MSLDTGISPPRRGGEAPASAITSAIVSGEFSNRRHHGPSDSPKALFLEAVVELWKVLHEACNNAMEHSISIVFE